jgi:hypothetical protein
MAMHPSGEQFYSGGLDSIISVWNIPNSETDPYDAYGRTKTFFLFEFNHFVFKIPIFYLNY